MVEMPVMPQGTERRNCSKIVAVSKWKIGDERTGKNPTRRPGEETRAVAGDRLEPSWNEALLCPAHPKIVSGNQGAVPAPRSRASQRGDKTARVACLGCLSADTADRQL